MFFKYALSCSMGVVSWTHKINMFSHVFWDPHMDVVNCIYISILTCSTFSCKILVTTIRGHKIRQWGMKLVKLTINKSDRKQPFHYLSSSKAESMNYCRWLRKVKNKLNFCFGMKSPECQSIINLRLQLIDVINRLLN